MKLASAENSLAQLKLKILIWNILRGASNRVPEVISALLRHNADSIFFSEYRNNADGDVVSAALEEAGYRYVYSPKTARPNDNTVLLASKLSFVTKNRSARFREHTSRFVVAEFDAFNFIGLHINNKSNPAYSYLSGLPQKFVLGKTIIAGDFNTGINYLDGEGYRFSRGAKFGALLANGWTDAWRTMHPLGNEFSWYSQKNNGFRIDHILLSTGLRGCLEKAEFSHVERETGTSDHSILAVELKPQ